MNLNLINPALWDQVPVPEREWIVRDLIPAGTVSLLGGDGAAGKTTLALQLAVARALDRDWIGTVPRAGKTLFVSAEDDANELHRRLDAVRAHYGASFRDLVDIELIDLVGENAVMGELSRQSGNSLNRSEVIRPTALFETIVDHVTKGGHDLVVIDALADAFAGDENNRGQARQFIGMLKGPARQLGCAFLCLAHPSLNGLSSGSGTSGSTAWNNSVRSRLYFETAKATDQSEPDASLRTLSLRKANYAPSGFSVTVQWNAGVYVPVGGISSLDRMALAAKAQDTFMALVRLYNEQGQNVSAYKGSNFAPVKFASHPKSGGIGKAHFATAMQELLDTKKIKIETEGPQSRRTTRLVVNET